MNAIRLLVLACCLHAAAGRADTVGPHDFAYGFTVQGTAGSPLWEVAVPEPVYRDTTRADLGDLRVFNAAGVMVPHSLHRPAAPESAAPAPAPLPVFPLYERRRSASSPVLHIVTNERGAVIDAAGAATPADATDRVEAYLVDASALDRPVQRLALEWRTGDAPGFAETVSVQSSDDLVHWQMLVSHATLADLRAGEAELAQREIRLPPRKAKYLRIAWPERLRKITLTAVTAAFDAPAGEGRRQWVEVSGKAARTVNGIEFDAAGMRPVDRVQIALGDGNAVVWGALSSAAEPAGPWRTHHSGTYYRLERDGVLLASEPVTLPVTTDRYWRLDMGNESRAAGVAPRLALGWVPHQLRFVAQGDAPFTVAFGSASIGHASPLPGVLDDANFKDFTAAAAASDVFVLGGDSRLYAPAWRTWLLWAVLVAGLVLLGWMVRRLLVHGHDER